jgi:hypothetical protein
MSTVNSYDRYKQFDELNYPLVTNEGVLSPAVQKERALANLDIDVDGEAITAAADGAATVRAATATADGLTTGLLTATDGIVTITSVAATSWVTLPDAATVPIGKKMYLWIGANGCEVRTPATSNQTINGGDADSNEAAMAANSMAILICVSATGWLMMTGSAPVPD